jgi:hypothetical protein
VSPSTALLIGFVGGVAGIVLSLLFDEWQTTRRVNRFWREWDRKHGA